LVAPRDVPHSFRNVGQSWGKMIVLCVPAGIERMFAELGQLPADEPPDIPRVTEILQRNGLDLC
jgi:hypothetical protein